MVPILKSAAVPVTVPKDGSSIKTIYSFNHNTTKLPLVGQHIEVNCRQCHPTLIFSEAKTECNECHTDVHQATAGLIAKDAIHLYHGLLTI